MTAAEGFILGMAAEMFSIAGPVIVYGMVLNAPMIPSELNDGVKHIKLETNYPFHNV